MKGVIFILIIYVLVLSISALVKYFIINYFSEKKGSGENAPTSKIYYIKNSVKPAYKKPQKVDIAIKGRIVEKDEN
jgi:flagellar basal body-associated protein FliL